MPLRLQFQKYILYKYPFVSVMCGVFGAWVVVMGAYVRARVCIRGTIGG